jgi:hypothetical protein
VRVPCADGDLVASRLVIIPPYRMLDAGTVVWSILSCCGGMRSRFNAAGGVGRVLLLE